MCLQWVQHSLGYIKRPEEFVRSWLGRVGRSYNTAVLEVKVGSFVKTDSL